MINYKFSYITGKQASKKLSLDKNTHPYINALSSTNPIEWKNQHNFVTGSKNPHGLQAKPQLINNMIQCDYTFNKNHSGPPIATHGGVHSALADELMGLACFCIHELTVTLKLDVNYRHPVFLSKKHTALAWIHNIEQKKIWCEAIIVADNTLCAEISGLFYRFKKEDMDKFHTDFFGNES